MYRGFSIVPDAIGKLSGDLDTESRELNAIAESATQVKRALRSRLLQETRGSLDAAISEMEKESKDLALMENKLAECGGYYTKAEQSILAKLTEEGTSLDKTTEAGDETKKNYLADWVLETMGNAGKIPSIIKTLITDSKEGTATAKRVADGVKSLVGAGAVLTKAAEAGWTKSGVLDTLSDATGFSRYFDDAFVSATKDQSVWKNFTTGFQKSFTDEIDDLTVGLKDGAKLSEKAGSASKIAGYAAAAVANAVDNIEEYQTGTISKTRAGAEFVIETAVDIGFGAVATGIAGGALAAVGVVGAPVIAVGAGAAAITVGANWACEAVFGKDMGECVSDAVCDMIEDGVGRWFQPLCLN